MHDCTVEQAMVLVWDRNKWKHQVEKRREGRHACTC